MLAPYLISKLNTNNRTTIYLRWKEWNYFLETLYLIRGFAKSMHVTIRLNFALSALL